MSVSILSLILASYFLEYTLHAYKPRIASPILSIGCLAGVVGKSHKGKEAQNWKEKRKHVLNYLSEYH